MDLKARRHARAVVSLRGGDKISRVLKSFIKLETKGSFLATSGAICASTDGRLVITYNNKTVINLCVAIIMTTQHDANVSK